MNYTFDQQCVSDLHKDAIGFRPQSDWWDAWNVMSDGEKQTTWDALLVSLERANKAAQLQEEAAVERFSLLVANAFANGAKDLKDAYSRLMRSSRCMGDWDYFRYLHGLPSSMNFMQNEPAEKTTLVAA